MSLILVEKDVTTVTEGIVAHGVNCQGKMASGVAKCIKEKWPRAYREFMKFATGEAALGKADIFLAEEPGMLQNDRLFIANCYTQLNYGYDGAKYASVPALESSLYEVFKHGKALGLPVYMPQIGCGLGGLSWEEEVLPVVERYVTMFQRVDTYVCTWNLTKKDTQ